MPVITEWHMPPRINNPMQTIEPLGIILHYVANPGTSARANANYFWNVTSQTSVHYVVDDEEIIEIIPPYMKTFGTSDGAYNSRCIQIEMCHPDATGEISEATLENVVWLCRKLVREYGTRTILRHYDVTGKKCPLWYVNNPDEWEKLKARILKEEAVTMDNTPSEWSREALNWAIEKGIIRGDENGDLKLRSALTREEFVVMLKRYHDSQQ